MSQEKKYKYESIFAHASFQFCGHIDEYLIENTKYLTLIRFQTRFGNGGHKLERYENGVLKETRSLRSSHNIFLYYFLCSWNHNIELRRHIQRVKKTTVAMFTHPVGCYGYGLQKILGKVKYAFWPWDWFPPVRVPLKIYAAVVKHYIRRVDFPFALTEGISKEVGKNVPVVMLGMKRLQCADVDRTGSKRILVVGQLRRGQGIEDALEFIAAKPQYSLTLLGAAANGFESEINRIILDRNIQERVEFPNHFVSEEELCEAAAKCFCGLALYDTAGDNFTHYADPGKVKSYLEMGLPVVMTRISGIVPYVERFKAGVVIDSLSELPAAVSEISRLYAEYNRGARDFAAYFGYEDYYKEKFRSMEYGNLMAPCKDM
ncbi:MAG: hypothetical protein IKJ37_03000 [Kiritimatiellae bacterium]|nr:hypothetical protein [Kiritimatiellia bacterium]